MFEKEKIYLSREISQDELSILLYLRNNELYESFYLYNLPETTFDISRFQRKVNEGGTLYYTLRFSETKELIGYIGLYNLNYIDRNVEIAIIVLSEYRGQGNGRRALEIIEEYCFNYLNLNKIYLSVISGNIAAYELYKKQNYIIEGTFKNHIYKHGNYHDIIYMAKFKNGEKRYE